MTLSPDTRFNQYEIVAPLGAGGMRKVFLAREGAIKSGTGYREGLTR